MTSADVMRMFVATVPQRLDPRVKPLLRRRVEAPDVAGLHLRLTGPGGGDFTLDVRGGRLRARRGVPRPPRAVAILRADDLLNGKLDRAHHEGDAAGRKILESLGR
jgi:hypothetical protein